ncbi:hypothetical protein TBLA_0B05440 [Henningerozyma blattae CBS 6284]|uniref:Phosphatidic acid phosphatase type 2/haloperoxidase domain-containing protein n=1 Tax=Henningerozyma blattae (strain ATCC 34711 / CBS 6284 / DSM 70876 / NBRC 10599 / NRRL Y-10934 / UCD 77-7) TaxID=1071380 RepID=I2GZ21_HENB6|nr:hypothetical protein TBLA_0B05440 [Tetrapisispora blattae CBS 6284]CCH59373.1 hypothetical protein TBLA_0B05440 [Tetrapisispora blattae CBS 6284]
MTFIVVDHFQKWFLSEKTKHSNPSLSDLDLRFNPMHTINYLKNDYKLNWNDFLHYSFLFLVSLYTYELNPAHWILKSLTVLLLLIVLFVPITSQFFVHSLPILTWLSLYFNSLYVPIDERPKIVVQLLPSIETILYGTNISEILCIKTNPFLDLLAWVPYGFIHFALPFVIAALLFVFGPPTSLRCYSFAFGYINLLGVLIQVILPTAPPWYKTMYGLEPANYDIPGSPGGLIRIDTIFNRDIYSDAFTNSSVIFGALPSLHSGCATMEILFFNYCFPNYKPLYILYMGWLWWSTMYLNHHYFIDLILGSLFSFVIFEYTKYFHLPKVDTTLFCRWSYSTLEKYAIYKDDPLKIDTIFNDNDVISNDTEIPTNNNNNNVIVNNVYVNSSDDNETIKLNIGLGLTNSPEIINLGKVNSVDIIYSQSERSISPAMIFENSNGIRDDFLMRPFSINSFNNNGDDINNIHLNIETSNSLLSDSRLKNPFSSTSSINEGDSPIYPKPAAMKFY